MKVIEIFKKICSFAHCSGKTDELKDYIKDFCENEGFFVEVDTVGNILCTKGNPILCLQAHYDMVCIGKAPKVEVYEKNGFLKAKDSSLGADNGMGVALMLYLSQIKNNIELLFTNDEEIGMIGANGLNLKIKSKKILNLDTEEEGKVYIGCAGGIDIDAEKEYKRVPLQKDDEVYALSIKDLQGGHSGVDIDKNIPNAIKELGYYLAEFYPKIISINGGETRNSIPKNVEALIVVGKDFKFMPNKMVNIKKIQTNEKLYFKNSKEIIDMICGFSNGVRRFDKKLGIPSISVNLSKIQTLNDKIILQLFPRANENEFLKKIKIEIKAYFENLAYKVYFSHEYNAWKPEVNKFSKEVLEFCKNEFKNASFSAIHAGLECGILLDKLGDDVFIASIGPNIFYPHSVQEKCDIESVKRFSSIVEKIAR